MNTYVVIELVSHYVVRVLEQQLTPYLLQLTYSQYNHLSTHTNTQVRKRCEHDLNKAIRLTKALRSSVRMETMMFDEAWKVFLDRFEHPESIFEYVLSLIYI